MRNQGSSLIVVAVLVLLIGALSAAFQATSLTFFRASSNSTDEQLAVLAAQSGAAYYIKHVQLDPSYFTTNPPPLAAQAVGDGAFAVESAVDVVGAWKVVIVGTYGQSTHRLGATLGKPFIEIPEGLVVGGTGNPSDVTLTLSGDSLMASYSPAHGPFDPLTAGDVAHLGVNGSLSITSSSTIAGDVSATGILSSGTVLSITGTLTENAAPEPIESIDPYVNSIVTASLLLNDNVNLAGIFGGMWGVATPLAENWGNLNVSDGGTYVVPAGTYRFRTFNVKNGSTVIFDTSSGPVNLIYEGAGAGTGVNNDLTLNNGTVKIDPGGTDNGLLTVLHDNADFKILNGSSFGQAIGDENNAGYSQIISLGGNMSSDDVKADGGSTIYGRIYAAAHTLSVLNGSTLYGSALAGEAIIHDSTFAVDLGTLGVQLEAQSTNAHMLAQWDV